MPSTASAIWLGDSAAGEVAVERWAALTVASGVLAAAAVRCGRLAQLDGHGSRHAEAQLVLRVAHEDAHLVDQAATHFGGLYRLGCELGRGRNVADPGAIF